MMIATAVHLEDTELVDALGRLAHGERAATVALIVHLAEFDARRLYAAAGFSSSFEYCVRVLHLSEDAAINRIEAARAARRYPRILDMLVSGVLSPTTARMLARHLTPENQDELLAGASGLTKEEVEELLARRFPKPDVPTSIRPLPPPPVSVVQAAVDRESSAQMNPPLPAPVIVERRPVLRPLAEDRYEIRFTARASTRDKLRRAQDLLGHAVPRGDLAEVFDRALTLLVADLERKKCAETSRPRPSRVPRDNGRHIPAEVKRAVWKRDEGRCAFVAADGHRCGERRFLEFHHVNPYAAGGKPTVENIQLRCRAHNRYEADVFYRPGREYGGIDRTSAAVVSVPERMDGRTVSSAAT